MITVAPPAPGRVLPTLNPDGTRRWLTPKPSHGRFHRARRVLAWALIALFTAIPYVDVAGRPLILLDVPHREFTVAGTTFLPTETMLLALLLVGIFLAIFVLTALFGRVWCGWACPQTVYMEFVYRPLERAIRRPLVRHLAFLAVSMFLAHTFLAYFVGVASLRRWITGSPVEHPVAFLVMAGTTALMLLDFGWFREQVCLVACPYGRFQSALLDRHSLIVAYDPRRGEPRGRYRRSAGRPGSGGPARTVEERPGSPGPLPSVGGAWGAISGPPMAERVPEHRPGCAGPVANDGGVWGAISGPPIPVSGDCVDCRLCVATCPMGMDVRDGLQMECIHCAQCIDACETVMTKLGRPRGLIRHSSRAELQGEPRRWLRPRLVFYPVLLVLVLGALTVALARRAPADVTVLRGSGSPFVVLPSGEVSNQVRIKIANRSREHRRYLIDLAGADSIRLIAPENPLGVAAGKTATATVFVAAPRAAFAGGQRDIGVRVSDGAGFSSLSTFRLLGPSDGGRS